jgi:hypothetical protein
LFSTCIFGHVLLLHVLIYMYQLYFPCLVAYTAVYFYFSFVLCYFDNGNSPKFFVFVSTCTCTYLMLVHVLLFQIHVYVLICSSLFLVLLSPSFVLHFSCFDCFYSTYHLILFILLCLNPFLFFR